MLHQDIHKAQAKNHQIAPKILQLIPALESGGVEKGAFEIARALDKQQMSSLIASAPGSMVAKLPQSCQHIHLALDKKNPLLFWSLVAKISKIISEHGINVVHACSRWPAWIGYYAAMKSNCHFITGFHGFYGTGSEIKKRYNSIMLKGERVIAVSDVLRSHILQEYSHIVENLENKIEVIYRGVDCSNEFHPDKINTEICAQLAKSWGLQDGVAVILFPARFSRWKGHLFFLDALEKIPTEYKFCCIFMGDMSGNENYIEQINKKIYHLGLKGIVRLQNHTPNMREAYYLADMVVAPSLKPEAFGRIAIEAQAMCAPVLAMAHGGSMETISDGVGGWLLPEDQNAWTAKITELLALNQNTRQQIGYAGRDYVSRYFSLEQMGKLTVDLYHRIVNGAY